ncbi:hypothetical protein [Flavivirga jejuensis]|uniref:Uncharacterized protein n=1 Tax=Flavivirga jejuensis TaxID=870487 RepID=A0ABT8WMJ6_9FLAO|nr:hypothetical protein [Flavivirga jejuensis]MDO5974385.1 hypothetical protein [Flavivirga jejuensis]
MKTKPELPVSEGLKVVKTDLKHIEKKLENKIQTTKIKFSLFRPKKPTY